MNVDSGSMHLGGTTLTRWLLREVCYDYLAEATDYGESVRNNLPAWRDSFLEINEKGVKHIIKNHTLVGRIDTLLALKPTFLDTKAKELGLNPSKLRKNIELKVK